MFIEPELLNVHEIKQERRLSKNHWRVPCVNKFIPVFLRRSSSQIKMRMKESAKRFRTDKDIYNLGLAKKKVKFNGDQTPITVGEYEL